MKNAEAKFPTGIHASPFQAKIIAMPHQKGEETLWKPSFLLFPGVLFSCRFRYTLITAMPVPEPS